MVEPYKTEVPHGPYFQDCVALDAHNYMAIPSCQRPTIFIDKVHEHQYKHLDSYLSYIRDLVSLEYSYET